MADTASAPRPIKLIAFAASLRRDSWNRKLLNLAVPLARDAGAAVDVTDFHELVYPAYNHDDQQASGIPETVQAFGRRMVESDGLIIASPEYNFSMPGTLKNTIDWLSRIRPVPFHHKWVLLLSASNGRVGGNRGLWHLRQPLESLGAFVHPEMFSLAEAPKAFDEAGELADVALRARLEKLVRGFVAMVGRATP
jgi:NAD(P)H-dependent FMN reductase